MKATRPKIIAALLLFAITGLCIAGTKVSKLVRTTTFGSNDLFIVVTGSTVKVTRHIQAHDLATGLGPWITNSGGGGGSGDVTTTQLNHASNGLSARFIANDTITSNGVLSAAQSSAQANDITTSNGVLTASRASDIITSNGVFGASIANSAGRGTNTTLYGTIQLGDATAAGSTIVSNDIAMRGSLLAYGPISMQNGAIGINRVTYVNAARTLVTSPGVDSTELEYLDGVTGGIQTNLDGRIGNSAGRGTNTTLFGTIQLGDATGAGSTSVSNDIAMRGSLLAYGPISMQNGAIGINRVTYVNAGRTLVTSPGVDSTELEYLDGVTAPIQTQIDNTITNINQLGTLSNATIKPLIRGKSNRMLDAYSIVAGANITLTLLGDTNISIAAPSIALSDGDFGDITLSSGTTVWTVDSQAITWGKITNIAGYSVPGKATTGSGSLAPITAGTDTVFGRLGSGDLGFAQIGTGQIAAQAVTYAKIQNISGSQVVLGRSSASAGTVEEVQPTTFLDWIGAVQGQLLYRNGSTWGTLAPGTSGQVLTTGGAGANPAWANSAGTTNPTAFASGSFYLTNAFYVQGTNAYLGNTNMFLDGGRGILFSNVFAANAGGLTNVLATNILDGEKIEYWFFPSNGVTVNFPQFAEADFVDGQTAPRTNRWNLARIWRFNTTTNIQITTKGFDLAATTPNFFFTTNYAAGVITNTVNPNLTNLQAFNFQVETRLIPTNNALSNIVVNFGVTNYVELFFTNNLTFTNWSGLGDDGQAANVTYLLRPQLINRGVNWGNLGLSNPGYSVAVATNANNLLWTTLTNSKTYALTMTRVRTNIFPTLTLWE